MYKLYGDGIHDDYPAIQEMLDSGISCVYLPPPGKNYVIGKCLKIHSNQELKLDRFTVIKLSRMANCSMLENADPENYDKNICVTGGIWDMNHNNQFPNPYHFNPDGTKRDTPVISSEEQAEKNAERERRLFSDKYSGHCFRFNSIIGFVFRDITIVNPVVYGFQLAFASNFTIENIVFEYTEGSPKLWNLDGIHIEGGCKNGYIHNLKGACHDDLVAITSYDAKIGPIENIVIDGIIAEHCHSAVRLLSIREPVRNVHITNVFGTYYVYLVIMSRYYDTAKEKGIFENIKIDNVCASFSKGTVDVAGNYGPFIDIEDNLEINNLSLKSITRNESVCFNPTIGISEGTVINHFEVSDCVQTGTEFMEFIRCRGKINSGEISNISVNGNEYKKYEL